MKILHIGNVAGVSTELARAQRELGHQSDVLVFSEHPFNYPIDILLPAKAKFPFRAIEKMIIFPKFADDYDILHFHGGADDVIMPKGLDFPLWKTLGKQLFIHHHGHDIRDKRENPFFTAFSDQIFVSTPDLIKYSPKAKWLPSPFHVEDTPNIGVERKSPGETIDVVHAPTNRIKKGTGWIVEAVEGLKREGYKIELTLVENQPHEVAMELFKKADIVVDQLRMGWYGVFAEECMALGKPVCCYVAEDLVHLLPPAMPLINSTKDSLKRDLKELAGDFEKRAEYARRSRSYVEEVHGSIRVAKLSMGFYGQIP
jgi:hypothetical protein